jgi:DNA-directed RNA polymerase specialized sigma24 family protein
MSTLFRKFDSLTVTFSESDFSGRFSWVETVADTELYARLKTLSYADLELLTLFVIDGYLQTEIAEQLHTKRQNINNKIARIKKYLK